MVILSSCAEKSEIEPVPEPEFFTIISKADINGGTIYPSGASKVLSGKSIQFEIKPFLAYKIKSVTVDNVGVELPTDNKLIVNVTKDSMSVFASFQKEDYFPLINKRWYYVESWILNSGDTTWYELIIDSRMFNSYDIYTVTNEGQFYYKYDNNDVSLGSPFTWTLVGDILSRSSGLTQKVEKLSDDTLVLIWTGISSGVKFKSVYSIKPGVL